MFKITGLWSCFCILNDVMKSVPNLSVSVARAAWITGLISSRLQALNHCKSSSPLLLTIKPTTRWGLVTRHVTWITSTCRNRKKYGLYLGFRILHNCVIVFDRCLFPRTRVWWAKWWRSTLCRRVNTTWWRAWYTTASCVAPAMYLRHSPRDKCPDFRSVTSQWHKKSFCSF